MIGWLAIAGAEPGLPDPDEVAEEIVITAGRAPHEAGTHPVAVEVIDRVEIEASGAETLAELLQEQPGLAIDRTPTGTAIRIQGMDPEHTLILIDGRRVLGRKDGVIDLSRLSLSNIESVEIAKGAGSAMFGSDAMGGVIQIRTRRPESASVGGHLRLGTLNRVDASADLTAVLGPSRHRGSVTYRTADGWDRDDENPATDASDVEQSDVTYRVDFEASSKTDLSVDVAYMQRHLQAVDQTFTGAVLDRLQTIEDGRVGLHGRVELGSRTTWTSDASFSIYRDQFVSDQRGAQALDLASHNWERMFESGHTLAVERSKHQMVFGVDGLYQHLETDRLADGVAQRGRVGAFVSDVVTLKMEDAELRLNPSIRADVDTQFGSAVTPRMATSLTQGDSVVRLSVGTGFRAPGFRELYLLFENPGVGYVVAGNETLRPERSLNASVGYAWAIPNMELQGSFFYNDVRNLIAIGTVDLEPGALQRFGYENIDRARIGGVELSGALSSGPLKMEMSYTGTYSRDLTKRRPLQGRVPHRVTSSLEARLAKEWTVRGQAGFSSARQIYVPEAGGDQVVLIPALLTMDVRTRYRFSSSVETFFGIDNLLNAKGTSWSPQPPRQAYVGLTVRGPLFSARGDGKFSAEPKVQGGFPSRVTRGVSVGDRNQAWEMKGRTPEIDEHDDGGPRF